MASNNKRKRDITVVIERDEDGVFVGSVPSLPHCHSQAKTLPTLLSRMKEAIELCLEVEKKDFQPLKFIGVQSLEL